MKHDNYYIDLERQGYYESVDKRSKDYREYKEWKKAKAVVKKDFEALKKNVDAIPKGLGDVVAKVTKATGIDEVVKFVAGEDWGVKKEEISGIRFLCLRERHLTVLKKRITTT